MAASFPGTVAILPAGALGVAFFHHLTAGSTRIEGDVVFLGRRASASVRELGAAGVLRIETGTGEKAVPWSRVFRGELTAAAGALATPSVILVATNPDQIFAVLGEYVALLEQHHAEGRLHACLDQLPALMLCANGIYYQRVRRTFTELLEEAELLGRLPELWPDLMPRLVGRLLRGVTLQTSLRRGSGAAAVYRPGPSNRTAVAGGDPTVRKQVVAALAGRGGWFEDAGALTPTRVEFDKALINLSNNLLGQFVAIDDAGRFRACTVGEVTATAHQPRIRELVTAVVRVGQAVRVYPADENVDAVCERVLAASQRAATHVPSSLQWIETELAAGRLTPALTPTEAWLLHPLRHYAQSLGDARLVAYFDQLEKDVVAGLHRAIAYRGAPPAPPAPESPAPTAGGAVP